MPEIIPVGIPFTMVQDTVYALPARASLINVTTAAGTIEVSNDQSTWDPVTLTNGAFYTAAAFARSIDDDSIVDAKQYTIQEVSGGGGAPTSAEFLTADDESADLPNSRELLAGTNITFDDTTPGERTVSASGGPDLSGEDYLTHSNEAATLPNSRRLLAGNSLSFNDAVANQRTINVAAPLYSAFRELTDAEIKALPTTSIQLVATPGANKMILPMRAVLRADVTGGDYTNIDAAANMVIGPVAEITLLSLLTEEFTGVLADAKVSALLANAANDSLIVLSPNLVYGAGLGWAGGYGLPTSGFENGALKIILNNQAAGDLTGGNAANFLRVSVTYHILNLTTGLFE